PPYSSSLPAPSPSETYSLSLHDALPICAELVALARAAGVGAVVVEAVLIAAALSVAGLLATLTLALSALALTLLAGNGQGGGNQDRKSTRLNSSHVAISYAVFCLKKKKT